MLSQEPSLLTTRSIPATYLIDKNGVVQEVKVEGINWYTPEIIEKVSQLLK